MMKSMIAENGLTFKELEKNIYSWICQIGRERICISGYGTSGGAGRKYPWRWEKASDDGWILSSHKGRNRYRFEVTIARLS